MASILFQPWSIFLDMHNLKRECFSNHGLYFFKKVSKESFLNYLYQNRICASDYSDIFCKSN